MLSEVAAKGKNVTGLEVGDRVYPYPTLAAGDSSRVGTVRGFSEFVLVPDCQVGRPRKASELGFETCISGTEDLAAKAAEVFGSARTISGPTADIDIFIEATGVDALVDTYLTMGKVFSRMVVVGVHQTPHPIDPAKLACSQHSVIGSGGCQPEDVATVMEILESGGFDIESINTHEFPQDEIVKAIETADDVHTALNAVVKY
ncbi:zinc-binding dehydrogenase [Streptomyces caniscabiei]|nr:zinc-binding dehydrogenase [Streptomyces caniscabiei]